MHAGTRRDAGPLTPVALVLGGIAILMCVAALVTPADADLWGHLIFGRDIVREGRVTLVDDYAFTSQPAWINHEWLAEVLFFQVYRYAGISGLVVFKLAIIGAMLLVVWRSLRRVGASGVSIALTLAFVFVSTYWRTHNVRPQLFSVLIFALLLTTLHRTDRRRWPVLLLVPLLMALWTNLHGGWIVGAGTVAVWASARVLDRGATIVARLGAGLVAASALAATLLNPYGSGLWMFLAETVRLERADTEDWNSILTAPIALGLPWALTVGVAACAVWRHGWPRAFDRLLIVGGLAFASFRVSRLDAFFALSVAILWLPPALALHGPSADVKSARAQGRGAAMAILAGALIAMAIPVGRLAARQITCIPISGAWAPDEQAARFIAANKLHGRMLTWYDWGEYVIWHFGPDIQVSMDGRRETVYLERTTEAHRQFYANAETGPSLLQLLAPDYIWLPSHLPVIEPLPARGWTPIFRSGASVLFARAGSRQFIQPDPVPPGPRCFPGP